MNFLKCAKEIEGELIGIRRHLHMHPELDYELPLTSSFIKEFLDNENIPYKTTAGSGIYGIIEGEGNHIVALRADMDALPLQDKKSCEYSSIIPGKMHACGHDAHMTILLGAAKILNSNKKNLPGKVLLLFEPAEETSGGSKIMIEEGILEEPYVDAIIGLHVNEALAIGTIGVKRGVIHAASNPFTITIKGRGGHGAHPEDCIDPIVVGAMVVSNVQTIISREMPPQDAALITFGCFNGGTAQNIIPEEVVLRGIIRTVKAEHRDYVKRRFQEVVHGIVTAHRAECEIFIEESYPCLYNNDKILDSVIKSGETVLGKENVVHIPHPSMGVESFAYFSLERPSAFYFLGCGNSSKGIVNPAHGPYFDIDEQCLVLGTALQCENALNILNELNV